MRILLIQPSEFSSAEISPAYMKGGKFKLLRDRSRYQRILTLPPLGLMYLATPLLEADHEVAILDAYTLQLSTGEVLQEAIRFNPDLIGISLYSRFLHIVYQLTKKLKATLNVPIVLGGAHPTAVPDKVLTEFTEVDYVIRGWAEYSLTQLAGFLSQNASIDSVEGLAYRKNGSFIMNPEAELPKDLDEIPMPDRDLLQDMYDNHMYSNITSSRRNMDVLLTSRNCPFSCRFCFQHWRSSYHLHSPDRVLAEISQMAERGIDAIEIMDDNFTLNKRRVNEILVLHHGSLLVHQLEHCITAGLHAVVYGSDTGLFEAFEKLLIHLLHPTSDSKLHV
ncbi:B12-binding domain-containing radical SAM protein, partial [Planctomycetota bacterium]